jgi:hypothetical protein
MSKAIDSPSDLIRRLAHFISDTFADEIHAQRVLASTLGAPDHYVLRREAVPDTYAEFLYRTSGALLHEPTARRRAHAGQ